MTAPAPGSAVWALQGGFPVGGRLVADDTGPLGPGRPGFVWVNLCSVGGQHLPQMYRTGELGVLTAAACPAYGLCAACLGFGTLAPLPPPDWYPVGVDELPHPCRECEGSGRVGLRSSVFRGPGVVEGTLSFVPHEYVPEFAGPMGGTITGFCLGCGNDRGHESHQEQP